MTIGRRELLVWAAQLSAMVRARAQGHSRPQIASQIKSQQPGSGTKDPFLPSSTVRSGEPVGRNSPQFDEYASVEAVSQDHPVYGFDYMMYVYGASPDLFPDNMLQEGNTNPGTKIRLKKSWEIKNNLLGSNTAQVPRTRKNDSHPTLPIHLIDGDPKTVWCSFGSLVPDEHPEWIRIDLPIEATVESIALVCGNEFYPNSNFGQALPKHLEVKVSTDAWHWETVYSSTDIDTKIGDRLEMKFSPRRVKQVWIIGNNFTTRINTPSSAGPITFFSIVAVEVKDTLGNNLALVSRGAGVTVSSTYYGHADNRLTQAELWAPLHYDVGMTWLRIAGAEAGAYDWRYTERETGHYEFDRDLDAWLTDLHRCGVKLIWGLDIYANPIYKRESLQTKWAEARFRRFTDGTLGGSFDEDADYSAEMLAAYLRYVEFVVRHLKGRVYIYEVGNEFTGCGWDDDVAERYMRMFAKTYDVVKRVDPHAQIMPASPDLFAPDFLLTLLGEKRESGLKNGSFLANGGTFEALESSTLVIVKGIKIQDGELRVQARNRGRFGLVVRYTSPESFVVAGYGTCWPGRGRYTLIVVERDGARWNKAAISSKSLDADLSQDIQLKVRVDGRKLTLEASDGNRTESLSHQLTHGTLDRPGDVGLIQLTGVGQAFSNLSIRDRDGSETFRDAFQGPEGSTPSRWQYIYGPQIRNPIPAGWAPKIDGLGWHPYNPPDRAYFDAIREFKQRCSELGFRGRYYASELYHFFTYPPRTPLSELQHGVISAISAVGHSGLDTVANTQILHFTGHATADSNCRITWPSEIATRVQPSVMYYVWRNLATVLDDFHSAEFAADFENSRNLLVFRFRRARNDYMIAAWLVDPAASKPNEITDELHDLILKGIRVGQAWVIDIMNGTEQELVLASRDTDTIARGIRVKNYPTLVRFVA